MGMPNIPDDVKNVEFNEAVNLILASIGMEELALAHVMNAEGEKIQAAVASFNGKGINIDQLLSVNESVQDTIIVTIKQQMLLQFKLENVMKLLKQQEK